ncbi:MAG: acyl-CoA dehydrogenase family protein [Acidimicrobiales bacterium]
MLLQLTPDQEFLQETTAKFLDEQAPVAEIRHLRHDPAGFDERFWRRGAELGWTSLLVSEEHGGGSVSGQGVVDLSLLAYEFGRRAAPGPFLSTNVVAAALDVGGTDAQRPVLDGLLTGEAIATWCDREPPPHDELGAVTLEIRADGQELVLNGVKRPVEFGGQAHQLLVTGRTGEGVTQVLVPAHAPGVTVVPLQTVDLTRRLATVTFDDVRVPREALVGDLGRASDAVERQLQLALVILASETVGAMQTAFDMTLQWAFDRYTFGRPIASYQALKHRFADMKASLEASHAIADAAAAAVQARSTQAGELVSTAKAFIGERGTELMHECVQLHGGMGMTFELDLHLYLRRATLNRVLYGTPAEHRRRVGEAAVREMGAA